MSAKNDLIKYLLKEGKITIDEALQLASGETDVPIEKTMFEGAVQGQKDIKQKNLDNFVSGIIGPTKEYDPETGRMELVSLDLDKCVRMMTSEGCVWYNPETGCTDSVSKDRLKKYLDENIHRCIKGFIEHNTNGKHEEYWSVDYGGYIIETRWADEEHINIETEVLYVPTRTLDTIKFTDIA